MQTSSRQPARYGRCLPALIAASLALGLLAAPAAAQPVTNSTLYYRMGGGSPGGAAANRGQLSQTLGMVNLRLNYSCGKFDLGLSWQTLMNGFSKLGTQVTNAIKAGIASLPLYILQRAQPGLYQLFQNYSAKADAIIAASLKTCEEMEAMIRAGQNPYEDWVKMAQGDLWKIKAEAHGDVVQAKLDIMQHEEANKRGVEWVLGKRAGGVNSPAIEPIRDLSLAGYNVTLNLAPATSGSTSYSSSAQKNTRLVRAFPSANDLVKFATEVLGDKKVYTCTQGTDGCPAPTTVATSGGLGPKYEAEYDIVMPKLDNLANASGAAPQAAYADLEKIAAPGMAISPQLLDSLRRLPADTRAIAVNRLAQELSMHRVIDKALLARGALLTGMSLPQVTAAGDALRDTQATIDRMTHYIDDLMYESRIRKELTSDTALAIMNSQLQKDSQAMRVPDGRSADPAPLQNGRVSSGTATP